MREIISKEVNIYEYPTEFENSHGSVTIGDLHGNAVKLLHFLLRHHVVQFKADLRLTEEQKKEGYKQFVSLYENLALLTNKLSEIDWDIENSKKEIESLKKDKERFVRIVGSLNDARLENYETERTNEEVRQRAKEVLGEKDEGFYYCALNGKKNYDNLIKTEEEKLNALNREKSEAPSNLSEIKKTFDEFLQKIEVKEKNTVVRLIGDELADRGSNDYFILKQLGLLHHQGINTHILLSNHGSGFLEAYDNFKKNNDFSQKQIVQKQAPSFVGLTMLHQFNAVSSNEISDLVEHAYKPKLKVIDYTLTETGISLFTHAPVEFALIRELADVFNITYKDRTNIELAQTIDQINNRFAEKVKTESFHDYVTIPDSISPDEMDESDRKKYPLSYVMWNRWGPAKDTLNARPKEHNGYQIHYYHGHDPYKNKTMTHVHNLDNACGKASLVNENCRKEAAQNTLRNNSSNKRQKDDAQEYLDSLKYEVLVSDEWNLDPVIKQQGHLQPDGSFLQKRATKWTGLFAAVGFAIGVGVGVGLVATGVLAPFGVGLLGILALAAPMAVGSGLMGGALGFGSAKLTERTVKGEPFAVFVDKRTSDSLEKAQAESSFSHILAALGGRNQLSDALINTPDDVLSKPGVEEGSSIGVENGREEDPFIDSVQFNATV